MKKRYGFKVSFGFGIREGRTERGVYAYLGRKRVELRERYNFEKSTSHSPEKLGVKWREPDFHGLYVESKLPLPRDLILTLTEERKTYAEAVGYKAPTIDWILDEFDSSFNDLAAASLRFHLDYSILDRERHREQYQDIIDRLLEPMPEFTDEEMAILEPPGWTIDDMFEELPNGNSRMVFSPGSHEVYEAYRRREEAWVARQDKARHDFVDIMRGLWS
ncbi:hypothetical protein [Tsukamurella tyrosinosolvens]|uniref:hypothetical protein n=1 Tax=Tsukamurella tyrosinosolvens TaxID=57704 RepID=UPI0034632C42